MHGFAGAGIAQQGRGSEMHELLLTWCRAKQGFLARAPPEQRAEGIRIADYDRQCHENKI